MVRNHSLTVTIQIKLRYKICGYINVYLDVPIHIMLFRNKTLTKLKHIGKDRNMTEKILAAVLLLFGGGVTLYIIYRAVLGIIQPMVQKKPGQQNSKPPQNNLQLQNQQAEKPTVKKP